MGKDSGGMIHNDRIYGTKQHADKGDSDCISDQRRDEPDDELQAIYRPKSGIYKFTE
jgi:hypothetical protein